MSDTTNGEIFLTRRDIIIFEQRLKRVMSELIPFKGHSILFPRKAQAPAASWLDAEKKLLLPMGDASGMTLGVFVARGVNVAAAKALIPLWPALNRLIIDNLLLYKRSLCDPVTGLYTRHYLLDCMGREMEAEPLRGTGKDGSSAGGGLLAGEGEVLHRGSVGILAIRMVALRDVVREFGYQFADALMKALAETLTAHCPEQASAARIGDSEFAVLLPAATPKICRALAEKLAAALQTVSVEHPLRRERVSTLVSVGFILYPQDMDGALFVRAVPEQARLLLRKARLAAALAGENMQHGANIGGGGPVMAFGRILAEGGRVLETLPLSRVVVSLGAGMHAREGLRFSVWSGRYPTRNAECAPDSALAPLYKGEVVLMDVGENISHAEISHVGDPAWSIESGDRLALLPEEQSGAARNHAGQGTPSQRDPMTGLLRHSDFFAKWAEEREQCDSFVLALVRLAPRMNQEESAEVSAFAEGFDGAPTQGGQCMVEAVELCREELGRGILGGRYGLNSLVFFHPHQNAGNIARLYEALVPALEERLGLEVAVGIACHPHLDSRKSDALDNCRKALEYAMLLPKPHVGVLDSLALNISADKRFSQGDTFGAIKEYQLALLADEKNGMAWNSLGICLAGIGRHAEAERHFIKALECRADDPMALYNLGYVHQVQNQTEAARARYLECLRHAPEHLYALIRLGQLHELAGDTAAARDLYEKAAEKNGGESLTRRHFARLCLLENKAGEAREHLHEALIHDPQDALALQMLARLYLDAGEDPDMAASLARQSVSLRPGLKSGWLDLARALDAMGQTAYAREARLKAGEA